jgi:hypothetical protein
MAASLVGIAPTLEQTSSFLGGGGVGFSSFRSAELTITSSDIVAGGDHVLFAFIARTGDATGFGAISVTLDCNDENGDPVEVTPIGQAFQSSLGPVRIGVLQAYAPGWSTGTITAIYSGLWYGADDWLQVLPITIIGDTDAATCTLRTIGAPPDYYFPTPGSPATIYEADKMLLAVQWSATDPDFGTDNGFSPYYAADASSGTAGTIFVEVARRIFPFTGTYDLLEWDSNMYEGVFWAGITIECGEYIAPPPPPTTRIRRGLGHVRG